MAKKHLMKYSKSLVIREVQTKTFLKFLLTPIRMTKIKKKRTQEIVYAGRDMEQEEHFFIVGGSENL